MRFASFLLLSAVLACGNAPAPRVDAPPPAPENTRPSFRAFTPPEPLRPAGASLPSATRGVCHDLTKTERDDLERDELAALDAFLRQSGGMLLPVKELDRSTPTFETTLRGPHGERWMTIPTTAGCGDDLPVIAMDASHEVYIVTPLPTSSKKVRVEACSPICSNGCGMPRAAPTAVVEIPEGAHLGGNRMVTFPMKEMVEVVPGKKPCPKYQ